MNYPPSLALRPPRAWRRWLPQRPFDWVPACLYVGVLIDYLVINHARLLSSQTLLVVLALALLLASERWEHWRFGERAPRPVRIALLALNLVLVAAVVQLSAEGIGAFLYLVLPLKAWVAFGRPAGYLASLFIMVVYVLESLHYTSGLNVPIEYTLSSYILFATAIAFVLTISHLSTEDRRDRERAERLLAQLERSHQELAAYAAQAAELAAAAERNRIARDIHDSLGHYLTAINIQLEKALAFQDKNRAETHGALQISKRMAHEALADVRRSVGLLRSGPLPFSLADMLRELVAVGASDPPIIELSFEGDERLFSVESRLVLYRVVQEGLTNIRRHAQAQRAALYLRFDEASALLKICDDGVGFASDPAPARAAAGFGLQGIRERVALASGTVEIARAPGGGTAITVIVPRAAGSSGPGQEEHPWIVH